MSDIVERIDALLANTPPAEIEEFEVTRCLRDAKAEIESLRLESSQTIDDLRFEVRRAKDERDLWTVKASQLQHLLDN